VSPPPIFLLSPGSTPGWRSADEELARGLIAAGAEVEVVRPDPPPQVPTFAATDLLWALACRSRAAALPAEGVILYCSITAALLWPRPGPIRFDTLARENRPGRHGVWQRPLERRRLREAPLLVPMAEGNTALPEGIERVVVPVAVGPSGPASPERPIAAITYGANPQKKGIRRVVEAFAKVRREGEELLIAGCAEADLARVGAAGVEGVKAVGHLTRDRYRALLRSARVYICAPQREDYGIAQLEALADGCQLVTTPSPGPYPALGIARALDPRLVGEDLAKGLRTALDDPLPDYHRRALELLTPFSPAAVQERIANRLLPALRRLSG
jgi:glycosyltransferase involved in cell wall biosynthesis